MSTETTLLQLDPTTILFPKIKLRSAALKDPKFADLVQSVKAKGVLQPITVRAATSEDGLPCYEVVDGTQRLTAAQQAGLASVPAIVRVVSNKEMLDNQIILNEQRIETKKGEYCTALKQMVYDTEGMSIDQLAARINKPTAWVAERIGVAKNTIPAVVKLLDEGKMTVANAIKLSTIPLAHQEELLVAAQTKGAADFTIDVTNLKKHLKELNSGLPKAVPTFEAVPKLRKISELQAHLDNPALREGLLFALSLDPATVEIARQEWQAEQAAQAKLKEEREAKKAAAKAAKAAEEAKAAEAAAAAAQG